MSTIVTDTITGKSTATTITIGSTPVVSASANSMTIRGEGSAQTSIQQGLCKAWVTIDGEGTIAIIDSFNIGSITDNETGDYSYTVSNNTAVAKHPVTGSNVGASSGNFFSFITSDGIAQATTGDTIQVKHHSGADEDCDPTHIMVHGDLA